jgi:hypothetical protein
MYRWELVSVVILLCQGLIFENDAEIQENAILFFGVTAAMIMIAAVVMSLINTVKRMFYNRGHDLVISKSAMSALTSEDKQQILQIFSEEEAKQNGSIQIRRQKLESLTPGQNLEITGIVSKQYQLGDEAFEQHAAQLRVKSLELDKSRFLNTDGSSPGPSTDGNQFTLTLGITTR